ncbi:MAG: AAA family ATPase, partial [Candidatus Acidiferrales bacterium]
MKLALIGTHGVGKTTLAFEICSLLKKAGRHVELVTEVARQSPFPVNAETTLEGQLWILHAQIAAELDAARRAPNVIADRSVLDNYCYLVNKFGRQAALEPWLAWWMNSYAHLVGVPTSDDGIQPDGFRSDDRAFQARIHEVLIELLSSPPFDKIAPPVLWLRAGDRADWAAEVFEVAMRLNGVFREPPLSESCKGLRTAVADGEIRRDESLEAVIDRHPDYFDCDSLDLVEIDMELESRGSPNRLQTVGDFLDFLDRGGFDDGGA